MQLFHGKLARKAFGFAALLLFSVPFGLTVTGCKHAIAVEYCNGGDSGPQVGQVASISLSQSLATYGESLSYGQIGQSLSASALDCKGNSVSVSKYTYASTNGYVAGAPAGQVYADINPTTGQVCAGTWNRNSGGGVADYTVCTAPAATPANYVAYLTATSEGATSNAVPVFVHAQPNSVQIGNPSTNCTTDPTTNCCPLSYTAAQPTNTYTGGSCLSQGATGQVVSRVLDASGNNITCQVGHVTYSVVGATNSVTFDQNGVGTANQPGSATITAAIAGSGSSSTAGFWSTCPPTSIVLTANGNTTPVSGLLNVPTSFTTVVKDKNNVVLTGLSLEYESTTPQTIPAGSNTITPIYPGSATITAVCTPPSCDTSPYSQIDLYGNGTTLTSNGVQLSATGESSSVIYVGSTEVATYTGGVKTITYPGSQYIYPYDFTTGKSAALLKLPYVPNSMVISLDGSTIYLGSSTALMTVNAAGNSVSSANVSVTGPVISIAPNGSVLIVTDPIRETVSLVSSTGTIETTQGGVATSASWAPDSDTVYITTKASASYPAQVLVYNVNTSWTKYTVPTAYSGVTVTVPHIGAYFAGADTEARSYCPTNTVNGSNTPQSVVNAFYPVSDIKAVTDQQIVSTNDGAHVLAAAASPAAVNDFSTASLPYTVACPAAPTTIPTNYFPSTNTVHLLAGVTASAITGVVAASNSKAAFVTYTGTGQLPIYYPATATTGTVTLSGTATAPVSGVFASNDAFFYVGTAGDNLLHIITMTYPASGNPTAVDSSTLTPGLPNFNNTSVTAVPNVVVQRVKKPTT